METTATLDTAPPTATVAPTPPADVAAPVDLPAEAAGAAPAQALAASASGMSEAERRLHHAEERFRASPADRRIQTRLVAACKVVAANLGKTAVALVELDGGPQPDDDVPTAATPATVQLGLRVLGLLRALESERIRAHVPLEQTAIFEAGPLVTAPTDAGIPLDLATKEKILADTRELHQLWVQAAFRTVALAVHLPADNIAAVPLKATACTLCAELRTSIDPGAKYEVLSMEAQLAESTGDNAAAERALLALLMHSAREYPAHTSTRAADAEFQYATLQLRLVRPVRAEASMLRAVRGVATRIDAVAQVAQDEDAGARAAPAKAALAKGAGKQGASKQGAAARKQPPATHAQPDKHSAPAPEADPAAALIVRPAVVEAASVAIETLAMYTTTLVRMYALAGEAKAADDVTALRDRTTRVRDVIAAGRPLTRADVTGLREDAAAWKGLVARGDALMQTWNRHLAEAAAANAPPAVPAQAQPAL
eukprot:m.38423 g.38423  ORF g.38423 m.38423 type:complete len:484 (+) comp5504_c0_seq1:135-1586(+)